MLRRSKMFQNIHLREILSNKDLWFLMLLFDVSVASLTLLFDSRYRSLKAFIVNFRICDFIIHFVPTTDASFGLPDHFLNCRFCPSRLAFSLNMLEQSLWIILPSFGIVKDTVNHVRARLLCLLWKNVTLEFFEEQVLSVFSNIWRCCIVPQFWIVSLIETAAARVINFDLLFLKRVDAQVSLKDRVSHWGAAPQRLLRRLSLMLDERTHWWIELLSEI